MEKNRKRNRNLNVFFVHIVVLDPEVRLAREDLYKEEIYETNSSFERCRKIRIPNPGPKPTASEIEAIVLSRKMSFDVLMKEFNHLILEKSGSPSQTKSKLVAFFVLRAMCRPQNDWLQS